MLASWKTSLFGLGAGALNLFANGTGWKQVLLTTAFAALGVFSKDHDVSTK